VPPHPIAAWQAPTHGAMLRRLDQARDMTAQELLTPSTLERLKRLVAPIAHHAFRSGLLVPLQTLSAQCRTDLWTL